ncbi:MAG: bile acid:sodium symporter [Pseudomonadota bacterium]
MTSALILVLKLSVGAIILAIGMGSRLSDLAYLWKRPGLMFRSLLAMYVLVPLVAFALVKLLVLPTGVEIGLLVLAVSAGAPLLPRKLMYLGQGEYVFSLVVISTLLAIFIVPAWLAVLGPHFGNPDPLEPGRIALVLAKSFFLPLAAGMLMRWLFPVFAERFGDRLMGIAGLMLVVCALALFALHWDVLLEAHWDGVLTLAGLTVAALAIGHWLGGTDEDNRTALAIACSTRHLGIAVLVAASVPGPRTAVIVAAYILIAAAVSIPYLKWRRRMSRATEPAALD